MLCIFLRRSHLPTLLELFMLDPSDWGLGSGMWVQAMSAISRPGPSNCASSPSSFFFLLQWPWSDDGKTRLKRAAQPTLDSVWMRGEKKPTKNCYFVKPLRVSGFICYRSVTWYSLTKTSTDRLVTKTNNKKNAVPLPDLSSLSSLIPQLLLSRSFGLWWPCFYVWLYF